MSRRRGALALALASCIALSACTAGDDTDDGDGDRSRSACSRGAPEPPAVELRYRVESGPGTGGSFGETMRALCARLDTMGVADVQVRQAGPLLVTRTPSGLEDDVRAATTSGEVRFYDWEPNALGRRGPDVPFSGSSALFEAVRTAFRTSPRAESTDVRPGSTQAVSAEQADRMNDSSGPRYYLFGADRRPIAGPAGNRGTLTGARGQGPPPGSRVLTVPQGVLVVEAPRASGERRQPGRFFVLEDDSELSRSAIARPRPDVDRRTREPIVTFDFTDAGKAGLAALTQRIARRGAAAGGEPAGAAARFAIVLGDRILSLVSVDFQLNPDGLDGRTGGQIGGFGSLRQARRMARLLETPLLPGTLVPVR